MAGSRCGEQPQGGIDGQGEHHVDLPAHALAGRHLPARSSAARTAVASVSTNRSWPGPRFSASLAGQTAHPFRKAGHRRHPERCFCGDFSFLFARIRCSAPRSTEPYSFSRARTPGMTLSMVSRHNRRHRCRYKPRRNREERLAEAVGTHLATVGSPLEHRLPQFGQHPQLGMPGDERCHQDFLRRLGDEIEPAVQIDVADKIDQRRLAEHSRSRPVSAKICLLSGQLSRKPCGPISMM